MTETVRRPTRQRAAVEALLVDIDDFNSAQNLHARLRAQGQTVGLATVYRTLQAMAADGEVDMLRTVEGEAIYRRCNTGHHHHHLVCRSCGRTVEVDGPPVESWVEKVSAEHGFSDVQHTLEIVGTCAGTAHGKSCSPQPTLTATRVAQPMSNTRLTLDDLDGRLTCSVPEAGQLLGIGRDAAYRAAARGELPTLQLGRTIRVAVPKLLQLVGLSQVIAPLARAR